MNKRQNFRCTKYGIMIITVLTMSTVFCSGQEADSRGNTVPATAIWRQFFSGQFSPEMMQWYVQQNRQNTSPSTGALQRDLQNQRNRIAQRSYVALDTSRPRTATGARHQSRSVDATSTNSTEYLNMLGRLEFSLDKLGQKPNEILAPPSSSSVMARFVSGRKTPEMAEWKHRYIELANTRHDVPSPTSDSIQENMMAARNTPAMARPESSIMTQMKDIGSEQNRESLANLENQMAQTETNRIHALPVNPEGYDSTASVRLVSGAVPENEMPATYALTRSGRSEQKTALESQEPRPLQPAAEPEMSGKMKVYRPREDTVRVEASRPDSQTSHYKPAPPKPLIIVPEENEWNPVPTP